MIKLFLLELKDRLICMFTQNWHSHMDGNDKYAWFLDFNSNLQPEKYLLVVTHKWHRDMLCRFRTRTLGLYANKIWYSQEVGSESICKVCSANSVEDEFHFLFKCSAYDKARQNCKLLNKIYPGGQSASEILKCDNNEHILSLAKFVAEAYKRRKCLLSE